MTMIEKIYAVMDGFATRQEIDEEVEVLKEMGFFGDEVFYTIIANIDNWARWDNDEAHIVWDRMKRLGITVRPEYCTKD